MMSRIKYRGFASMSVKRRKAVARLGGLTAHKKGVAHEWNSKEATKAALKARLHDKVRSIKLQLQDFVDRNQSNLSSLQGHSDLSKIRQIFKAYEDDERTGK